jgi:hypothetical protein
MLTCVRVWRAVGRGCAAVIKRAPAQVVVVDEADECWREHHAPLQSVLAASTQQPERPTLAFAGATVDDALYSELSDAGWLAYPSRIDSATSVQGLPAGLRHRCASRCRLSLLTRAQACCATSSRHSRAACAVCTVTSQSSTGRKQQSCSRMMYVPHQDESTRSRCACRYVVVPRGMRPAAALTKLLRAEMRAGGPDAPPPRVMAFVADDATADAVANPLRNALWEEHKIGLVLPDGEFPTKMLQARAALHSVCHAL